MIDRSDVHHRCGSPAQEVIMDVSADLTNFGLGSMVRLTAALREASDGAISMSDYAQRVCELLHARFQGPEGDGQTALVRLYATGPLEELPPEEQAFASGIAGDLLAPRSQCLALLGTAGTEPEWNDRRQSGGHRVLPLVNADHVRSMPMVSALLAQMGIDVERWLAAGSGPVMVTEGSRYRVFHVPRAAGSPLIPAQSFVEQHKIVSAFGFGGQLPREGVFAVVVFTTVPVTFSTAKLFGTVALSVCFGALNVAALPVFGTAPSTVSLRPIVDPLARERLALALLDVHEQIAASEADNAQLALLEAGRAAARAAALAQIALQLQEAASVDTVMSILMVQGLPVLNADSGALLLRRLDASERVSVRLSPRHDLADPGRFADLDLDDSLPGLWAIAHGRRVLVTDRSSGLARFPSLQRVFASSALQASATFPLRVDDTVLGAVTFSWRSAHEFTVEELELMEGVAAQGGQAIDRMRRRAREVGQHQVLQHSLLTQAPIHRNLEIAVRYEAAADDAQVGGDWHDAFNRPDGSCVVVVGDVVGHDLLAAAAMGQLRNLLRGIALGDDAGPASILSELDAAMKSLGLSTFASALVATVGPRRDDGRCALTWSSAGHPPAMIRRVSGEVDVLTAMTPDLILGVDSSTIRADQVGTLGSGDVLLAYSDGLIERRGEDLDVGITRLAQVLHGCTAEVPLRELCAHLLEAPGVAFEDDVAMVMLRVR